MTVVCAELLRSLAENQTSRTVALQILKSADHVINSSLNQHDCATALAAMRLKLDTLPYLQG